MTHVQRLLRRARPHWPLAIPATISAVLSAWALGTVGWGNTYYSAAVFSMSKSWHAFWYGALDTAGFVTVDKPPMSMWVQAIAVKVFGFHSMTLLVPQVLAGVGAVVLVYLTLVRRWGRMAATVGALALAVTPISVMVNHSNNTDAILTFFMTATVYAAVRAADTNQWRWMITAGLLFGASFATKMLAAVPVLPAAVLAVVVGSTLTWKRRAVFVGVGAAVAIASALLWFTAVDLTPASARPYVGSSQGNSAYQLAFERNGVKQVEGTQTGLPGANGGAPDGANGGPPIGGGQGGGPGGGPGGGMSGFSGGQKGVLRLFNDALGTQIGWMVVPALAGLLGALMALRRRTLREPVIVAAVAWCAIGAAAYSVTAGIVHPYYTASLAPGFALLVGVGVGVLRAHHESKRAGVLGGVAVAATGVASWVIARRTSWDIASILAVITVVLGAAIAVSWCSKIRQRLGRWMVASTLVVLVVPAVWSAGSLKAGLSANLPYAQPTASSGFGRPGGAGGPDGGVDFNLILYLEANRGSTTWLVATPSAMTAGQLIIDTGEPVMALGGFSGSDQILTSSDFDALARDGKVRFVYLGNGGPGGGPGGMGGGPGGSSDLTGHVQSACTVVNDVSSSLYDCAGI